MTSATNKIIHCNWQSPKSDAGARVSRVLDRSVHIEGVDVNRYDCTANSKLNLSPEDGHIFSLLRGTATLTISGEPGQLHIVSASHLYLPPGSNATIEFSSDGYAIHVAAGEIQSRGTEILIHDERFLAPSRFILTPQYLSRRAFLHRDRTLISKSGDPLGWFHTTMFDTQGLPKNIDGVEVFKMSYNYQSEANIVYDIGSKAKVRFAAHPYATVGNQQWTRWSNIDGETTYYLNESADGTEVEYRKDPKLGKVRALRNRHEVFIEPGSHVSLCCMFDPGPTGLETHQPGEYSSYLPVADILMDPSYGDFLSSVAPIDDMLQSLSLQLARKPNADLSVSRHWPVYCARRDENFKNEARMILENGKGRGGIINPWRQLSD